MTDALELELHDNGVVLLAAADWPGSSFTTGELLQGPTFVPWVVEAGDNPQAAFDRVQGAINRLLFVHHLECRGHAGFVSNDRVDLGYGITDAGRAVAQQMSA